MENKNVVGLNPYGGIESKIFSTGIDKEVNIITEST